MKVIVLGAGGMLGSDVVVSLLGRGHEVDGLIHADLDVSDPVSCASLADRRFDWCLNCAAYTAVDGAESDSDAALAVNALGPGYVARACALAGGRLLHVSTDFVFNGSACTPYSEEDPVDPIGVYGRSKLLGEEAALAGAPDTVVVRTAWLYGPWGKSFPRTILRAWREGRPLRVVSDQIGSPTFTQDLAATLVDLIEMGPPQGIYHAAGPDVMSWHGVAMEAVMAYEASKWGNRKEPHIEAIRTGDWPTPARRPAFSALSSGKLEEMGIAPMRSTREAMVAFVDRLADVEGWG